MRTEYLEVTEDYLLQNRTAKGAWTRKQLLALGVEWPLVSGWKQQVIGLVISPDQQRLFEDNKSHVKSKKYKKRKRKKL